MRPVNFFPRVFVLGGSLVEGVVFLIFSTRVIVAEFRWRDDDDDA